MGQVWKTIDLRCPYRNLISAVFYGCLSGYESLMAFLLQSAFISLDMLLPGPELLSLHQNDFIGYLMPWSCSFNYTK